MKANTLKFLTAYQTIDSVVNREVIGKYERTMKEKEIANLEKAIKTYGSKITEEEFELISSELCCDWSDFVETYKK